MDESEQAVKSMEFCQDVIKRMASNSFKLKAWFLVVFAAIFTFYAQSVKTADYPITLAELIWLFPMLLFPYLDAFYLRHERIFVGVYGEFAESLIGNTTTRKPFDLCRGGRGMPSHGGLVHRPYSGDVAGLAAVLASPAVGFESRIGDRRLPVVAAVMRVGAGGEIIR